MRLRSLITLTPFKNHPKSAYHQGSGFRSYSIVSKNDLYHQDFSKKRLSIYKSSWVKEPPKAKIQGLKAFVGDMNLTDEDSHHILHGWSDFEVRVSPQKDLSLFGSSPTFIHADKVRQMGQRVVKFHLDNNTVFIGGRFLSLPSTDIEHDLDLFADASLVPRYMRQNNLYSSVVPLKGTMRSGPYESKEAYDTMKRKIHDFTSIGCFYTMVGMLYMRNSPDCVERFVKEKVVGGKNGLVSIAANRE